MDDPNNKIYHACRTKKRLITTPKNTILAATKCGYTALHNIACLFHSLFVINLKKPTLDFQKQGTNSSFEF